MVPSAKPITDEVCHALERNLSGLDATDDVCVARNELVMGMVIEPYRVISDMVGAVSFRGEPRFRKLKGPRHL